MNVVEFHRVFAAERARFAAHYPRYSKIKRTTLRLIEGPCTLPGWCAYRDFAYALPFADEPEIVVNTRLLSLPVENILGVLRHEFGHICDPNAANRGREQMADNIAEIVTGTRISYNERDVQTIGPGKYPRPRHLHQ